MKTEKFDGVMESAYGKKLPTPIKFDGTFEAYENHPEVVAAKDELTADETVKVRNTERKSTARQKAMQAALDAAGIIKPTLENDDQLKLKKMYEIFKAVPGTSDEEARAKSSAALNIEWAE